jgi:hypothetical protein
MYHICAYLVCKYNFRKRKETYKQRRNRDADILWCVFYVFVERVISAGVLAIREKVTKNQNQFL